MKKRPARRRLALKNGYAGFAAPALFAPWFLSFFARFIAPARSFVALCLLRLVCTSFE
jgi:hypothetical protein